MRADRRTDALYAAMRGRFGATRARANGYRYEAYFRREQAVLLALTDADARVVLDVACGSGLMVQPLRAADRLVFGVDFNAAACADAAANGVPVVRGDAFALPLAAASVEQIVNCQFFNQQSAAGVASFVDEVARVLVPGGSVILVWRNADALIHRVAHACLTFIDRLHGLPAFPQETHRFSELRQVLTAAGFAIEHEEVSCPPLAWRSTAVAGWAARVIGASCIMVARKSRPAAPP